MLTFFKRVFLTVPDVVLRNRSVRVGDDVLLQCELSSNLATPLWTLDGGDLQGYGLNSGWRTGTDGLLLIEAQLEQSGLYTCHAVENGVRVAIVSYKVAVWPDLPLLQPVEPPAAHGPVLTALPTPAERPSSEPPQELLPPPRPVQSYSRNVEAIYLSLVIVLGGLCFVLAVVLAYVGFCLQTGTRGKYSLRAATAAHPCSKRCSRGRKPQRNSALMELKTISNGVCNGGPKQRNGSLQQDGGFLQIVPGEGHVLAGKDSPPPAPPLPPPTPQLPSPPSDFGGGLSATLPSVLRRINGNSYVLLRQYDSENSSPHCNPFAEELNKILEKRKHTQLLPRPDESSV